MGTTRNRRTLRYVPLVAAAKCDVAFALAFASLIATLAACGGSLVEPFAGGKAPLGGEPAGTPPSSPAPTPPPIAPAVGPAYARLSPSSIPGTQRYVFSDDGTFKLQYDTPDWGFYQYTGRYSVPDSVVRFIFDANLGKWEATGIVRSDSLTVTYNDEMLWDDFEDGIFVRVPSP